MIYVFKDGSGYQQFPKPGASSPAYLEVTGTAEQRILNGDRYRLLNDGNVVEFLTQAEVEAEGAAAALTAEREAMVVSRFQARAALLQADLLDAAANAIAQGDAMTQLVWADAQEFRRNSPTVAAIAQTLGLTEAQLDDLFRQAKTIEA